MKRTREDNDVNTPKGGTNKASKPTISRYQLLTALREQRMPSKRAATALGTYLIGEHTNAPPLANSVMVKFLVQVCPRFPLDVLVANKSEILDFPSL